MEYLDLVGTEHLRSPDPWSKAQGHIVQVVGPDAGEDDPCESIERTGEDPERASEGQGGGSAHILDRSRAQQYATLDEEGRLKFLFPDQAFEHIGISKSDIEGHLVFLVNYARGTEVDHEF